MKNETKPSREREKNDQEPLLPPIQPVIDYGSVVIKNSRAAIHCLTIAGQIEGHMLLPNTQKATKYEHVLPLLAYLEESEDIDGVLFLLNTVGGDVEAGLAIAELISGMKKPTVSLVLGGGHSIGVPLAVAPMVTMIAPSASMTIHPVRTSGTIIAAPQTYQYFERLQERIVRFVTKHSNITRERFLALMMDTQDLASDVGSVLYGEEAVACGLVGRLGGLSDALEALYELCHSGSSLAALWQPSGCCCHSGSSLAALWLLLPLWQLSGSCCHSGSSLAATCIFFFFFILPVLPAFFLCFL